MATNGAAHSLSQGVLAALAVPDVLHLFAHAQLKQSAAQCLLLNGAIVLGSLVFVARVLTPLLHFLVPDHHDGADTFHWLVQTFLELCWLYPVYTLSIVLNTVTYQKIAATAYALFWGPSHAAKLTYKGVVVQIRDVIYRAVLCLFFFLQALALSFVPYVGTALSTVLVAWLYAFYCFEYVWSLQARSLQAQIAFFESRWAFFLGFGMPCSVLAHSFPVVTSAAIVALLFPLCIITATIASPPEPLPPSRLCPSRLPLFSPSSRCTLLLIAVVRRLFVGTPARAQAQPGTPPPQPKPHDNNNNNQPSTGKSVRFE